MMLRNYLCTSNICWRRGCFQLLGMMCLLCYVVSYPCQLFAKNACSVPGTCKPEHLFYDTNCDAKHQAETLSDPELHEWFKDIGMCVDVFHLTNKHKATHTYCQLNCNPINYPELMTDNNEWYFNTSISEQTNVWLGKYLPIVREMGAVKYNFFLDEMVRLKNVQTIVDLQQRGYHPGNFPQEQ